MASPGRVGSLLLLWLAVCCGCAELRFAEGSYPRPFRFEEDTFAFPNELAWAYHMDPQGVWRAEARNPEPSYTHRCFVLARSARQFFQHARFDPSLPRPGDAQLRALVRKVVGTSPRLRLPEADRIVIPGYASLRELSRDRPALLEQELGGPLWSYIERGNWRMVIPFRRAQQAGTARRMVEALDRNRPPVVHLVRFPHVTINHAVLVFGYTDRGGEIEFQVYDPNAPDHPVPLTYDEATRTFRLPRNEYFRGGRVDVYEIYHRPWF